MAVFHMYKKESIVVVGDQKGRDIAFYCSGCAHKRPYVEFMMLDEKIYEEPSTLFSENPEWLDEQTCDDCGGRLWQLDNKKYSDPRVLVREGKPLDFLDTLREKRHEAATKANAYILEGFMKHPCNDRDCERRKKQMDFHF